MDEKVKIAIATQEEEFDNSDILGLGEETLEDKKNQPKNLWELSKDILDFTFKIVLIIAGLFGAKEYTDRQYEARIQNALEVVDDWEDQGYLNEYSLFALVADEVLSKAEEKYPDNRQSATQSASNNLSDLLASTNAFNAYISANNFAAEVQPSLHKYKLSIERLNYFYGKVGLCVRDEICEPKLMRDYFGSSSCYFFDLMETHINSIRVENKNSDYAEFTQLFCSSSR